MVLTPGIPVLAPIILRQSNKNTHLALSFKVQANNNKMPTTWLYDMITLAWSVSCYKLSSDLHEFGIREGPSQYTHKSTPKYLPFRVTWFPDICHA